MCCNTTCNAYVHTHTCAHPPAHPKAPVQAQGGVGHIHVHHRPFPELAPVCQPVLVGQLVRSTHQAGSGHRRVVAFRSALLLCRWWAGGGWGGVRQEDRGGGCWAGGKWQVVAGARCGATVPVAAGRHAAHAVVLAGEQAQQRSTRTDPKAHLASRPCRAEVKQ